MQNNTKKTLKIYWEHIIKYKLSGLVIVFSVVIASVLYIIAPLYYKHFFDILGSEGPREIVANELIGVLMMILTIHLISWMAWRIAAFTSTYFHTQIRANIYDTCFRYLHKHSFSYFNNNFVGSLVKRVSYFVNSFSDILDRALWDFLPMVINISVIIIVLLWENYIFGILIFLWLVVYLTINWLMTIYKIKYDIQWSWKQYMYCWT